MCRKTQIKNLNKERMQRNFLSMIKIFYKKLNAKNIKIVYESHVY